MGRLYSQIVIEFHYLCSAPDNLVKDYLRTRIPISGSTLNSRLVILYISRYKEAILFILPSKSLCSVIVATYNVQHYLQLHVTIQTRLYHHLQHYLVSPFRRSSSKLVHVSHFEYACTLRATALVVEHIPYLNRLRDFAASIISTYNVFTMLTTSITGVSIIIYF